MENDETELGLVKNKEMVPEIIYSRFNLYRENNRRTVNKTIYKNKYFNLVYKINQGSLDIVSQGDIVYSAIPYDTGRKYIQMAAVQFMLNPTEAESYIRRHKVNLEMYLRLGIFELTGKRVASKSTQVQKAYDEIFKDTLFKIQVIGRLLQHDENGALSANLAGKFIYSENLKSGISEYLSEYLMFVIESTKTLPIFTDGYETALIDDDRVDKKINEIIELSEVNKKDNLKYVLFDIYQEKQESLYKQNRLTLSSEEIDEIQNEISELESIVINESNRKIDVNAINLLDFYTLDSKKLVTNENALEMYDAKVKKDVDKEIKRYNELSINGKSDITKGIELIPHYMKSTLDDRIHERTIKLEINNDVSKPSYIDSELAAKDKKKLNQNNNELIDILKKKAHTPVNSKKPILKSERGKELKDVRENYIAHSVDPKRIEKFFENVLPTDNANMINVVSDIHSQNNELPLHNSNFNILVGDISDSQVKNTEISGIYVLGNHELMDVLKDKEVLRDQKWDRFRMERYFQQLILDPDSSWPFLPLDTTEKETNFYNNIAESLAPSFPRIKILNNENYVYDGVRYIGITLPVALTRRKKEVQEYIVQKLETLLEDDRKTPTVVVSHAPLFNELSMLSPKSKAYNSGYTCEHPRITEIFKEYNIIGAIHGHHHIPASSGRSKKVQFAGKELFVVCSIYSRVNTGFELNNLL